jgi:hypothetical protein
MLLIHGFTWWKKKKTILRYWHNVYNNPAHGLVTAKFIGFSSIIRANFVQKNWLSKKRKAAENLLIIFSSFSIHRSDGASQMIPMRENPLYLMRDSHVSFFRCNLIPLKFLIFLFYRATIFMKFHHQQSRKLGGKLAEALLVEFMLLASVIFPEETQLKSLQLKS